MDLKEDPIYKDGYYIYPDGAMISESDAIEGLPSLEEKEEKDNLDA